MIPNDLTNPGKHLPSASDSRLYVGNLSPAVDEFALVALFSKFGKISKLDFLFHKSGVLRGKPRGYAFIEMNRRDEALKAMVELNNKPVRGKRILVTQANESQYQEHQATNQSKPNHSHQNNSTHQGRPGQRGRPVGLDPMRPTTLSILKSQQQPKGVNNKIAALEAKLASMQQTGISSTATPSSSNSSLPPTSTLLSSKPSFLPDHPHSLRTGAHNQTSLSRRSCKPSTMSPTRSSKTLVASYNHLKNPPSLDTIGLTLKEQLKRNRELKSSIANTANPALTAGRQRNPPTGSTSPRLKKSRTHSTSSNTHGEPDLHLANTDGHDEVSLQFTEKACDTNNEFKRQKLDPSPALSDPSGGSTTIPEPVV